MQRLEVFGSEQTSGIPRDAARGQAVGPFPIMVPIAAVCDFNEKEMKKINYGGKCTISWAEGLLRGAGLITEDQDTS